MGATLGRRFWIRMAADSLVTGNEDGEDDCETPTVDEGRRTNPEGARAREYKDNCHRGENYSQVGRLVVRADKRRSGAIWLKQEAPAGVGFARRREIFQAPDLQSGEGAAARG
jgi:hypothetical protein